MDLIHTLIKQCDIKFDGFGAIVSEKKLHELTKLVAAECARICVAESRQLGGRACADDIKEKFGIK
jgi:hypothetical protein